MGLKIRGIYSAALTRFFADHQVAIVQPSPEIKEAFQDHPKIGSPEPVDVLIRDSQNQQGILLKGKPEPLHLVSGLLRRYFFDAILRKRGEEGLLSIEIEFPSPSKSLLDDLRNRVLPTVPHHHRLRIIASEYIDQFEKAYLAQHPEKRILAGKSLEAEWIWRPLSRGKEIRMEHAKVDGRVISLLEAEVIECQPLEKKLVLERKRYAGPDMDDGLNLPQERGDYIITEAREGEWFVKHSNFRRTGTPLGNSFSINTPVEFYPGKLRYVDLEIDVLQEPEGKVKILEGDLFAWYFEHGYWSEELVHRTKKTAEELKAKLIADEK